MKKYFYWSLVTLCVLTNISTITHASWKEDIIPVAYNDNTEQWYALLCWDNESWNIFVQLREKDTATEGKLGRANKTLKRRTNLYSIDPKTTYIVDDPENRQTFYIAPVLYKGRRVLQNEATNEFVKDFAWLPFREIQGQIGTLAREHNGQLYPIPEKIHTLLKGYLFDAENYRGKYEKPIATLLKEQQRTIEQELALTPEQKEEKQIKMILDSQSILIPVAYRERTKTWYALIKSNIWMPFSYDQSLTNAEKTLSRLSNNKMPYNETKSFIFDNPAKTQTISVVSTDYLSPDEMPNSAWVPFEDIKKQTTLSIQHDNRKYTINPLVHNLLRSYLFEQKERVAEKLMELKTQELRIQALKNILTTHTILIPIAYDKEMKEWNILLGKHNGMWQPFVQDKDLKQKIKGKVKRANKTLMDQTNTFYSVSEDHLYPILEQKNKRRINFVAVPFAEKERLEKKAKNAYMSDFRWITLGDAQTGTKQELGISAPASEFLNKYTTDYQTPLQEFLQEQKKMSRKPTPTEIGPLLQEVSSDTLCLKYITNR